MSNRDKRLTRLEQKTPIERQFIGWEGNPWTEEQKAEAIRREPKRQVFWRSLREPSQDQADTDVSS
jgi:hypothetical protein